MTTPSNMDLLFVLKNGSHENNEQLRYALRTMAVNGRNIGRVFICCDELPSWMNSNIIYHLPYHQPYNNPAKNILSAVVYVVDHTDINDFLLCSDDHFYLEPTDFDHYPVYRKGELPKSPNNNTGDPGYAMMMYCSRLWLCDHHLPATNFAQHCHTHFYADDIRKKRSFFIRAIHAKYGVEPTCLSINLHIVLLAMGDADALNHYLQTIETRKDRKYLRYSMYQKETMPQHCISIYDSAWPSFSNFMNTRFPAKSIFEL